MNSLMVLVIDKPIIILIIYNYYYPKFNIIY